MKVYIVYDTSTQFIEKSIRWVFTDREKAEKTVKLWRTMYCNPCLHVLEKEVEE